MRPVFSFHASEPPGVFTVGHSTRTIEDFIGILKAHGIERLVDVRTLPRSKRNPQFDRDTLPRSLSAAGIIYAHIPALGGLRRPRADSPNGAWRNDSFRGYADYMQTPEFEAALALLIEMAGRGRVAIMCAEAVPWRCHRSLLADSLAARGIAVLHILSAADGQAHRLTPFARIEGTRVTYPPEDSLL